MPESKIFSLSGKERKSSAPAAFGAAAVAKPSRENVDQSEEKGKEMESQILLTTVKRFKEERQSFVTVSEDKNGDRRSSSNGLLMEARQLDTPVERKSSAGELIDFNRITFVIYWTFFSNCNLFIYR